MLWEVEIQNVNSSDHINNVYPLRHLSDFRNVGNLLTFREKVLDLRPKSFCAFEMTIYVNWTGINRNRKYDHT